VDLDWRYGRIINILNLGWGWGGGALRYWWGGRAVGVPVGVLVGLGGKLPSIF
jgi:hypothetical protein